MKKSPGFLAIFALPETQGILCICYFVFSLLFLNICKLLLDAFERGGALRFLRFDAVSDIDFFIDVFLKGRGEGLEFVHGHLFDGDAFVDAVEDDLADDLVTVTERDPL